MLGLEDVRDGALEVLAAAGLNLARTGSTAEAVATVADGATQVVLTDVALGTGFVETVRARPDLAAIHVVVCANLADPDVAAGGDRLRRRRRDAGPVQPNRCW